MSIKEFRNGNINLKLECDLTDIERINELDLLADLLNSCLNSKDVYMIGEIGSYGNFESVVTLYNLRLDKTYMYLIGKSYETLTSGKTLKLYAHKPYSWERELINEWLGE